MNRYLPAAFAAGALVGAAVLALALLATGTFESSKSDNSESASSATPVGTPPALASSDNSESDNSESASSATPVGTPPVLGSLDFDAPLEGLVDGGEFLVGINVPWYQWQRDFGGGNRGVAANTDLLRERFEEMADAGLHVARWWMFPGNPWQIRPDQPAGARIADGVYDDIDAALRIAEEFDLYYVFTLFSNPTELPDTWLTTERDEFVAAVSELFIRYADEPRILAWDLFNEPEFPIWQEKIAQTVVLETGRALAEAIHRHTSRLVTVNHAFLGGIEMWESANVPLDFHMASWYDYMDHGGFCAPCESADEKRARFGSEKPIVVGEFFGGPGIEDSPFGDALNRWRSFGALGYSGAFAWSLFPERTRDKMQVDLRYAASTFVAERFDDVGPSDGSRPAPTPEQPAFAEQWQLAGIEAPQSVEPGGAYAIEVTVRNDGPTARFLMDIEVYGERDGIWTRAAQAVWDNTVLDAGAVRQFALDLEVPEDGPPSRYVVKIGFFSIGWASTYQFIEDAAEIAVADG